MFQKLLRIEFVGRARFNKDTQVYELVEDEPSYIKKRYLNELIAEVKEQEDQRVRIVIEALPDVR